MDVRRKLEEIVSNKDYTPQGRLDAILKDFVVVPKDKTREYLIMGACEAHIRHRGNKIDIAHSKISKIIIVEDTNG